MLRCIRFGEVLLDETFRTFLICNQCQTEFVEVPEFRVHLATTSCGQRLFEEEVIGLKFGAAQVTRTGKDKTYSLYNPADVHLATTEPAISSETANDGGDDAYLDLIKIEEELLDPRWYTDIAGTQSDVGSPQPAASLPASSNNKPMEYKELVEAVGPYVQFKETATKGKASGVVVKRFPNKAFNPTAVVKNPILPVKIQQSTNQPSVRLLNPAAKRKLELAPKQVQFNDAVNVKYVINEKLCTNTMGNKKLKTQNRENCQNTDSEVLSKRRKTINIPMEQANVQPDQQKLAVKRNSDVPKTTVGPTVARNIVAKTIAQTATIKLEKKPNSLSSVVAGTNSKANVASKIRTTMPAPQTSAQTYNKNLVPNPIVNQTQINGTKNQVLVKNPITYSKVNSNGIKTAPNAINKTMPAAAIPQQRTVSVTTTAAAQPAMYADSTQLIPPALAPLSSNKVCNPAAIVAAKAGVDTHQQTNDILNKLQTRGLQVKRTHPPVAITANTGQHNKTMELLQKLQSKGMRVKIVNGKETAAYATGATAANINASIKLPTLAPNAKMVSNMGNVTTAIGKPTKTILNNKLIIRKVK
ncbi:PREDICTED: uncharacterized protein LOC108373132 [Rhagoletis zephyria]|uniref:uncharacterized protein LOC108373132 n=1 Tax=Rhagoletis zephyria TaxID=28612 RepID=UPI000811983E|nr:PREDICTED: uncharacterized protein LOC108373132 [Rhagoletis zephyria]